MGTDTGDATPGILGYEVMVVSVAISEQILCSENTVDWKVSYPVRVKRLPNHGDVVYGAVPLSSCHCSFICQMPRKMIFLRSRLSTIDP